MHKHSSKFCGQFAVVDQGLERENGSHNGILHFNRQCFMFASSSDQSTRHVWNIQTCLPYLLVPMFNNIQQQNARQEEGAVSQSTRFQQTWQAAHYLEIGCGTGTHFQFYPPGCKVICTDPNPHFKKYLKSSMEGNDHITFDRFVVASGEDMGAIESESVDVVVCTLVLCSVNNIPKTLQETRRMLRPVKPWLLK